MSVTHVPYKRCHPCLDLYTGGLREEHRNGETHAFMSPMQLLRRLTSLMPPSGQNMIRYFGILGAAAKHRDKVVPLPNIELDLPHNSLESPPCSRRSRLDWASLLKRVWNIDALACPCGGRIRFIAVIEDAAVIRRILTHLHIPTDPSEVAPARSPPEMESWFASP